MKLIFKSLWQRCVLGLIRLVEFLSRRVSSRTLLRIGAMVGAVAFRLSRRYRDVALKNLGFAFGDTLDRSDKLRLIRSVFVNFAKSAMEFPLAARMSDDDIRRLVEFHPDDARKIRSLLQEHGALVGISAHFGNFELMARRYVAEGFNLSVVVRNDDNPAVADLLNDYRSRAGYDVIPRGAAIRPILKKLRSPNHEAVVMLPDQKSDDVFVPFFGKLAGTVAGPALVALRVGSPIVPVFCVRKPDDTHKLVFGDLIPVAPSSDAEADVERLMTQVNLAIESMVRAYPEQWLWLHDRWRVQPPPEVEARWSGRLGSESERQPA